jgi:hypothetical protein
MATFLIGQPGPTFQARGISRYGRRAVTYPGPVDPFGHPHRRGFTNFPAPELSDGPVQERPFVGRLAGRCHAARTLTLVRQDMG